MILEILLATTAVASLSMLGVLCFGSDRQLIGIERFVIPVAVGVFLALVFIELVPETIAEAPVYGGLAIGISFIGVYIFAQRIHKWLHTHRGEHNDKQEAALLVLFGDAIHNFGDGVLIAGAFLVNTEVGIAMTLAMMVHELPQELVEYGVLLRAGYTRFQALLRNVLSASTVILGGLLGLWFGTLFSEWLWLLTALVAANLLYLATTELLPRLHGSAPTYPSFRSVIVALAIGFLGTAAAITWAHEVLLPEGLHAHDHEHGIHGDNDEHVDHEDESHDEA